MQAERNDVGGLSEDVVSAATDMHDVVAPEGPYDDEAQALTRGKPMTPASQQPNPVNTAGARKKRGRPRTGKLIIMQYNVMHSTVVALVFKPQAPLLSVCNLLS